MPPAYEKARQLFQAPGAIREVGISYGLEYILCQAVMFSQPVHCR
jgi:hypothetical protein